MNIATTEALPNALHLELIVRDPEILAALSKYEEGPDRDDFVLTALRIGVLALRQASGIVDADAVRVEGERLVGTIRELLTTNTNTFLGDVSATLKSYFDPSVGQLPQRLDRLMKKDGELQALLVQHLDGDDSVIARTLGKHIGQDSPLLRLLSPQEKEGVIAALGKSVDSALQTQREHVLRQFSLDDKESALSRLVAEMTGANGKLRQDLAQDVQELQKEFSLDNEQGALCRLVKRVEKAQSTMTNEFSLDNKESALCRLVKLMETANNSINASLTLDDETSPLSRLRRGLTEIIERLETSSSEFHQEVKITLETFKARREEAARSTRHGEEFEDAVGAMLQTMAQKAGDVFEATGDRPGLIPRCKVGDHVITLGAESAAPGSKIVIEAKEKLGYDLAMALEESDEARKNREAQIGLFIFSSKTAPAGLEPFARHGKNLVVVWDQADLASDIYLRAAMSVAKALVVRERLAEEKSKDLDTVKRALAALTKEISSLGQICTWAQTVKRTGEKIGKKAESLQKKVGRHLLFLDKHLVLAATADAVSHDPMK